jgi:hypothetical protein
MKIHSKDFRVREGDDVDLKKWPTSVDPVYKSKEQYQELLGDHIGRLSAQQQPLYASNRRADFLGDGRGRQGRSDPARPPLKDGTFLSCSRLTARPPCKMRGRCGQACRKDRNG